jgi:hypothetical protein
MIAASTTAVKIPAILKSNFVLRPLDTGCPIAAPAALSGLIIVNPPENISAITGHDGGFQLTPGLFRSRPLARDVRPY